MRAGPRRSIIWLAVLGLLPLAGVAVETPRALSLPLLSEPFVAATTAPTVVRVLNARVSSDPLHDGEIDVTVLASDVISRCPNRTAPEVHCRDEGVLHSATVQILATRPADETGRRHVVACTAGDAGVVEFRARQNAAQGRGFIGASAHAVMPGELFRDEDHSGTFEPAEVAAVVCRVRSDEGVFHRVGTVAYGSVRLDVHTTDNEATDPFRHHYCARFEASAIPTVLGGTLVSAHARGRVADCDGQPDLLHELGRGKDDPEHG